MRIMIVGSGARSDAIRQKLIRDGASVFVSTDPMVDAAKDKPCFAIISPESWLAQGIVDQLATIGIPAVGPSQKFAQIETSKWFARRLLFDLPISGNFEHYRCSSVSETKKALSLLDDDYVVKADGLMGGKGVKLSGDHLRSHQDAIDFCKSIFALGQPVIIERKLDGEEFSLMSFCDGQTIVHMPPVQDHKRALEGDLGPNSGGMGSYSCADHLLPFLTVQDVKQAQEINENVYYALQRDLGGCYRGILYGSFMVTKDGLRVIEYNCRFGDPECLNLLPIMETSLIDICQAILTGTLDRLIIKFHYKATVCKYVVPQGYPEKPAHGTTAVPMSNTGQFETYIGDLALRLPPMTLWQLGASRSFAVVGIANDVEAAEVMVEKALSTVNGPVYHRKDIGTRALIQKRIDHMNMLRDRP